MKLERVAIDRFEDLVDVLCDAFHDYPVMRFVVGPSDAYDERLRALIGFFVFRRARQGGPLLLVTDEASTVCGAAVMTLPAEPEMPPDVAIHRDELWRALGPDARERYDTYARSVGTFAFPGRHYHLNMIGVRRAHAGGGIGRLILDAVFDLSRADADSSGVSLTTELPRNVELYQHCGYRIVDHAQVAQDLRSWGMFRDVTHPRAS